MTITHPESLLLLFTRLRSLRARTRDGATARGYAGAEGTLARPRRRAGRGGRRAPPVLASWPTAASVTAPAARAAAVPTAFAAWGGNPGHRAIGWAPSVLSRPLRDREARARARRARAREAGAASRQQPRGERSHVWARATAPHSDRARARNSPPKPALFFCSTPLGPQACPDEPAAPCDAPVSPCNSAELQGALAILAPLLQFTGHFLHNRTVQTGTCTIQRTRRAGVPRAAPRATW